MLTPEQLQARRDYIELLIRKAKEKAIANPDALLFDPQGRVLIDVELPVGGEELFNQGFTHGEQYKPSKVTTVSLDVTKISVFPEAKLKKYMEGDYGLSQPEFETLLDVATESDQQRKIKKLETLHTMYMERKRLNEEKQKDVKHDFDLILADPTFAEYEFEKKYRAQQPILNQKYMEQYGLTHKEVGQLSSVQSSIIPLQQEYHFHLSLASRTYAKVFEEQFKNSREQELLKELKGKLKDEKYNTKVLVNKLRNEIEERKDSGTYNATQFKIDFERELKKLEQKTEARHTLIAEYKQKLKDEIAQKKKGFEEEMAQAHHNAMIHLQPLIQNEFKAALEKAKKTDPLDEVRLINELDQARKRISAQSHNILMEEIIKVTGKRLSREDLKKAHVKHLAEATTATANDILHTDGSLQQATWISGSDNTAHERGTDTLADRQIATISLGTGYSPSRLQIRTPSLDVKEGIRKKDAINDISVKLTSLSSKYDIDKVITGKPGIGKAFTYNLHTAINDGLGDRNGNKQSEGARIILSGAHLYNKTQLDKAEDQHPENVIPEARYNPNPLCLVQNISVNGFGDSLGYGGDDLRTEATLISEMAMLYNLVDDNDPLGIQVQEVFDKYYDFLRHAPTPPQDDLFFSTSDQGKAAIKQIQEIKTAWKQRVVAVEETPVERAKAALKILMANELHHQHEYGKLVQSLSIFIEEVSIAGCKSGNERAQAINGRVAILDHEAGEPHSEIFNVINTLAIAKPNEVLEQAALLKQKLDSTYDHYLQSGASLISDVDQGASAKVNAKTDSSSLPWYKKIGAFFSNMNRNIAEESSLSHLSQEKAGKMQAHKGLTEEMAESWEPKGFGKYMGKLDVALSIVTFPLYLIGCAIAYGMYRYKANEAIESRVVTGMDEFNNMYGDMPELVPMEDGQKELEDDFVSEVNELVGEQEQIHEVQDKGKKEDWVSSRSRSKLAPESFISPTFSREVDTSDKTMQVKEKLKVGELGLKKPQVESAQIESDLSTQVSTTPN